MACEFSTVETVRLETLYVLSCIELGSRRAQLAGCTANPNSAWVARQARQLVLCLSKEYIDYYNTARPHQGLNQQLPIALSRSRRGIIQCQDVLGGILQNYDRDAA